MNHASLNRRQALAGLTASAAMLAAGRVQAFSDVAIGNATLTALSDGSLTVPPVLFTGLAEADAAALGETVQLAANTYAYRSGDRVFLFDAGSGSDHYISQQFPTVGQLHADLKAAGIAADEVTDIVISHMHIDHIGGLVAGGTPVFSNASVHLSEADWNFWNNEDLPASVPDQMKPMVNAAQLVSSIVKENVVTHKTEADLGEGVVLLPTPGHTPGHSAVMLTSGSEQIMLIGDAVVSDKVHFANPDVGWALEFDKAVAAQTRKSILDQAATDKIRIAGSHLSTPGIGFVEKDASAYRFVPTS
ncbi:MBL fold metallo-hydrolase [Ruegeria sp. HKCCA6707]|uniref:MBL fold metallo-hydrolase n=1 Tax=Ruegeria sp. HKCCA6707 TaxID=2682996 RepID=UPI001488901C|nr:MBL fold metallo-hydrolase [Ruegeria sp. HKCCA6707]